VYNGGMIRVQVAYVESPDKVHLVAASSVYSTLCGRRVLRWGDALPSPRPDWPKQAQQWCTHCLASYESL
jgi:hypothetical protein